MLFAAEGVARLAAFSVTFVIARAVGLQEVAVLTLAQSILAYATVAGDGGMGTGAVTRLVRGDPASGVIQGTARSQIALTLVASLLVVPLATPSVGLALALVLALTPLAVAASTTYVLQAARRVGSIAVARISGNLVTAALGVTAAAFHLPIAVIAVAYPAGTFVTMMVVNRQSGVRLLDMVGLPSRGFLVSDWRHNAGLFGYTLTVHIYSSTLLILSSIVGTASSLVSIALATRLLLIFSIPGQILEAILLPRYAAVSLLDLRRRAIRDAALAFAGGTVAATALILLAPFYVVLLFGSAASSSIETVQHVLVQIPISLATSVLAAALLAGRRSVGLTTAYALAALAQIAWVLLSAASGPELMAYAIVVSEIVLLTGAITVLRMSPGARAPAG